MEARFYNPCCHDLSGSIVENLVTRTKSLGFEAPRLLDEVFAHHNPGQLTVRPFGGSHYAFAKPSAREISYFSFLPFSSAESAESSRIAP